MSEIVERTTRQKEMYRKLKRTWTYNAARFDYHVETDKHGGTNLGNGGEEPRATWADPVLPIPHGRYFINTVVEISSEKGMFCRNALIHGNTRQTYEPVFIPPDSPKEPGNGAVIGRYTKSLWSPKQTIFHPMGNMQAGPNKRSWPIIHTTTKSKR